MTELTREMKAGIVEFLKDNLKVETNEHSVYTGGLDGVDLYSNYHTVTVKLDGTVIMEFDL